MLCGVTAFWFWIAEKTGWKLFQYIVPMIWIYVTPMLLNNAGVLPSNSEFYGVLRHFALLMFICLMLNKWVRVPEDRIAKMEVAAEAEKKEEVPPKMTDYIFRVDVHSAAIASAANVGGAASAPVVAAAHRESLVPVSILMALVGYAFGNYLSLVAAQPCRMVAGV